MSQTHNRGWQQVDTVEWFFTEFEKNEIYIPHTSYIKGKFILKIKDQESCDKLLFYLHLLHLFFISQLW